MMRMIVVLLAVLFSSTSFSDELTQNMRSFFQRDGYVIGVDGSKVTIDLGKGRAREGETFDVIREGKDIVHPVTGKVLGKEIQTVGRIKVTAVQENFSNTTLEGGKDVKVGDKIRLNVDSVCYQGSDEGFFKVSTAIEGLKKGVDCPYIVKEFQDGFGIEFNKQPMAFFSKPTPMATIPRTTLDDLNILARSKFIRALPEMPLSADIGDVLGNKKDFLVVLYSGRLEVYEVLKNDIVFRTRYNLPAGVSVSVVVGKVELDDKDYIIVNMVSGTSASSLILKAVGDSLIPVKTNIPYFMTILDKKNPKETFVGQRFDFSDKFGKAVKLALDGSNLKEVGAFPAPRGFRVDSAFMHGEFLVFTDSLGRLKVYRGGSEIYSTEEGFGGSYASVQIPVGDAGKMNYIFNPPGENADVMGFNIAFVIKNTGGFVQRFLDILKYSQGELYMLGEKRKDLIFFKQVRGATFEETIQAIVRTSEGRILVLTGKAGAIPVQNKGDLYEIELRVL